MRLPKISFTKWRTANVIINADEIVKTSLMVGDRKAEPVYAESSFSARSTTQETFLSMILNFVEGTYEGHPVYKFRWQEVDGELTLVYSTRDGYDIPVAELSTEYSLEIRW